jgi:hypothetical protein
VELFPIAGDESADEQGLVALPAFLSGGRVERTGIALVHEGEYIQPAPGSEAVISPAERPWGDQVVNLYFPVEVEVVGGLSPSELERIAQFVFAELDAAFRSRG